MPTTAHRVSAGERINAHERPGRLQAALEKVWKATWDVMVLDVTMPGQNGVEILKQIRQRGWDLCVIVLTVNPYEALLAKCQQLGAVAVLDKLDGLDQVREALLARLPGPGGP